jgi:MarR family transcriptional regulator, lower aerobic nicotinate degradation pathway regulator
MESHTKQESTRDVMDCIRRLVHFLRLSAREAEGKTGLSGAQLFVMQKLAEGGTLSVNELADRTRTHQSSVSVVVQKLVMRGFVARARAKNDARRLELSLTVKGKAILKKAPRVAQDRLIEVLDNLPDYNLHALSNLLGKITEDLGIGDKPVGLLFDDAVGEKRAKPRKQSVPG